MDERCGLCGGTFPHDQFVEFWDPKANDFVIAHVQCGIDAGLEAA